MMFETSFLALTARLARTSPHLPHDMQRQSMSRPDLPLDVVRISPEGRRLARTLGRSSRRKPLILLLERFMHRS